MDGCDGELDRRGFLGQLALAAGALGVGGAAGCHEPAPPARAAAAAQQPMPSLTLERLGRPPWGTPDPFLFCVHHLDAYPAGDERMAPSRPLAGRQLGQDFSGRDGWSMYHGRVVPGFPRHPHRGFETVTVTRRGFVDHSDSLGATARYGGGDAQWMTAGRGVVHAEMFPLRQREEANPLELFQIWINLPAARKRVAPHFTMFWHETIPVHRLVDAAGRATVITTIAGALGGQATPSPPPDSWAAQAAAEVAIWTLDLEPGAAWTLPAASPGIARSLYFYEGAPLSVAGQVVDPGHRISLQPEHPAPLLAGAAGARLLLLQGRPIGEPVAQHGPFVMNSQAEIREAYADYQRDRFGGWPWRDDAPVHAREQGRFAIHADGRRETPA